MSFEQRACDVIIQAGQSNAEGCGHIKNKPADITDSRVVAMEGDFSMHEACLRNWDNEWWIDFSIPFARAYIDNGCLNEGRDILILRTAVGGTGFADKRWGMTDDLYLRMMEMIRRALAMNPENRLVGLIWHQGETDVGGQTSTDDYVKYLTSLVTSVRDEFACPALPFVAANFVPLWNEQNKNDVPRIINGLRAVCRDIGSAAFVETDGLRSNHEDTGNGDTIHFSYRSMTPLGERYFEAWNKIKK